MFSAFFVSNRKLMKKRIDDVLILWVHICALFFFFYKNIIRTE